MQQWYDSQNEAQKLIVKHSCIGGAIALIPIPLAGEIAVIANQVAMYRGLNRLAGVAFSQQILKNIVKFLISQVAGVFGGMAVLLGIESVAKFIPGLNFVAGLAQAPTYAAVNYVCGVSYFKMLGGVIAAGGTEGLSDAEIIDRLKSHAPSGDEIRRTRKDAETKLNGTNYAAYKSEAQSCADEARANSSQYK